jgi:hypothetical protein
MQELSGVSEGARDLAMSRFRLIQPYLEQKRSLESVAVDAELSFRTVQRRVSSYRKFGLVALVRKSRDERGGRRVVSTKIKAVIEGLALERPTLPVRSIYRKVRQFAEATGEPLPRYGTVYDLVREIPSGLLTLANRGGKAYSEGFDLVHRREALRPHAIWQADHTQLSILLVQEDGQTARPGLTIVIDDYSRGLAIAALWNEGRLLAVINNIDEKPMLQVNLASNNNHWLGVMTQGTRSNRDGIGAQVAVVAGGRKWLQEGRSGSSYISQRSIILRSCGPVG